MGRTSRPQNRSAKTLDYPNDAYSVFHNEYLRGSSLHTSKRGCTLHATHAVTHYKLLNCGLCRKTRCFRSFTFPVPSDIPPHKPRLMYAFPQWSPPYELLHVFVFHTVFVTAGPASACNIRHKNVYRSILCPPSPFVLLRAFTSVPDRPLSPTGGGGAIHSPTK